MAWWRRLAFTGVRTGILVATLVVPRDSGEPLSGLQAQRAASLVAQAAGATVRPCPPDGAGAVCLLAAQSGGAVRDRLDAALTGRWAGPWTQDGAVARNVLRHEGGLVGVSVQGREDGASEVRLDASPLGLARAAQSGERGQVGELPVIPALPAETEATADPEVTTEDPAVAAAEDVEAPPRTEDAPSGTPAAPAQNPGVPAPAPSGPPSPDVAPAPSAAPPAQAEKNPDGFRRPLALREARQNGEDVRRVQNRLVDVAGMPRGRGGDGWYGPTTQATVRAFQAANGLPVTGVVDRTTWNVLFSARARAFDPRAVNAEQQSAAPTPRQAPTATTATPSAPDPAPASRRVGTGSFRRPLALGSPRAQGEDVRRVQNRLAEVAGMPRGGDGWYGPTTRATVRAFQEANGLPVTGVVDRATWDALFSEEARGFAHGDVDAQRAQ